MFLFCLIIKCGRDIGINFVLKKRFLNDLSQLERQIIIKFWEDGGKFLNENKTFWNFGYCCTNKYNKKDYCWQKFPS